MRELPLESSPIKVLQSVESFASYLREQFVSSTPAAKVLVNTHDSKALQPLLSVQQLITNGILAPY